MLATLRVVELGTGIAVPYAGRLLRRLGAEVTAVPAPDDPARLLPASNPGALLDYLRAGKTVVTDPEAGQLAAADLVLQDYRREPPDVPDGADLLCCRFSMGANRFSPLADNVVLSSLTGMSWAMGEPGRDPLHLPCRTAEFLAGLVYAGAALGQWMAGVRGTTELDVVSALRSFVEQNSTSYLLSGIGWRREGSRAAGCAGIYPYGVYSCADGQVALIARSTADWRGIAGAIGAQDAYDAYPDPFEIALRHADEVDALIGAKLAELSKSDVMRLAEGQGVLAAPVNTVADVLAYEFLHSERDLWTQAAGRQVPDLPFLVN